jgi:hypothetical protein
LALTSASEFSPEDEEEDLAEDDDLEDMAAESGFATGFLENKIFRV